MTKSAAAIPVFLFAAIGLLAATCAARSHVFLPSESNGELGVARLGNDFDLIPCNECGDICLLTFPPRCQCKDVTPDCRPGCTLCEEVFYGNVVIKGHRCLDFDFYDCKNLPTTATPKPIN
ncbi:uncharacterized protein LOC109826345 [Asparagus officinalis]|uniref:uncharacterized protein LOC109826345 n=1 Tax=Asparagus officinalis TaxID=4686 RepID=UPI00098E5AF9|nr:uncharacterized protein LOC109826345 [Asparagus officinalis]